MAQCEAGHAAYINGPHSGGVSCGVGKLRRERDRMKEEEKKSSDAEGAVSLTESRTLVYFPQNLAELHIQTSLRNRAAGPF